MRGCAPRASLVWYVEIQALPVALKHRRMYGPNVTPWTRHCVLSRVFHLSASAVAVYKTKSRTVAVHPGMLHDARASTTDIALLLLQEYQSSVIDNLFRPLPLHTHWKPRRIGKNCITWVKASGRYCVAGRCAQSATRTSHACILMTTFG